MIKNKHIYEIFLTDSTMESWNNESSINHADERYKINRKIVSHNFCKDIYVDEDYLYATGNAVHIFYERGISSYFISDNFVISKAFVNRGMLGGKKIIINGDDYFVVINSGHISMYKVRLSSPELNCPVTDEKDNGQIYGSFEFQ